MGACFYSVLRLECSEQKSVNIWVTNSNQLQRCADKSGVYMSGHHKIPAIHCWLCVFLSQTYSDPTPNSSAFILLLAKEYIFFSADLFSKT